MTTKLGEPDRFASALSLALAQLGFERYPAARGWRHPKLGYLLTISGRGKVTLERQRDGRRWVDLSTRLKEPGPAAAALAGQVALAMEGAQAART